MCKQLFNIPEVDDGEEWRDVVGFEGLYQVSNLGRVRCVRHATKSGKVINAHFLNPTGSRYKSVALHIENVPHNKLVHRLVAEAFIPNPNNLPEVNHKDKNVTNNILTL